MTASGAFKASGRASSIREKNVRPRLATAAVSKIYECLGRGVLNKADDHTQILRRIPKRGGLSLAGHQNDIDAGWVNFQYDISFNHAVMYSCLLYSYIPPR